LDQGKREQRKEALTLELIQRAAQSRDDAREARQGDSYLGVRLEQSCQVQLRRLTDGR
jgi:hypothetical protein